MCHLPASLMPKPWHSLGYLPTYLPTYLPCQHFLSFLIGSLNSKNTELLPAPCCVRPFALCLCMCFSLLIMVHSCLSTCPAHAFHPSPNENAFLNLTLLSGNECGVLFLLTGPCGYLYNGPSHCMLLLCVFLF